MNWPSLSASVIRLPPLMPLPKTEMTAPATGAPTGALDPAHEPATVLRAQRRGAWTGKPEPRPATKRSGRKPKMSVL